MRITVVSGVCEFYLDICPQETVMQIKQKIEQLLCVPAASQTLTVAGWELLDKLDMEDYPFVQEGTKIDLTTNSTQYPPIISYARMQIVVKFSARHINVEVDNTETVRSLKEKIHIMDGTPVKRMSLYFCGIELQDEFRNLVDYGITEFSEIVVFLKTMNRLKEDVPIRRINLNVQTSSNLLNAATIPIEMKDSNTVNELKQMLLSMKTLPTDEYIFIHKQRIMRESCSLRWHGVENGDSLYVFKGSVSRGS